MLAHNMPSFQAMLSMNLELLPESCKQQICSERDAQAKIPDSALTFPERR